MRSMHPTRSPLLGSFLALFTLLLPQSSSAQAQRAQVGPRNGVHPQSIETFSRPFPGGLVETHAVWIHVPRTVGTPLDVELRAASRTALLSIDIDPPVRHGVAPDSLARFT